MTEPYHNQVRMTRKNESYDYFDFVESTINEINPAPLKPSESLNLHAMMAEFVLAELYMNCLIRLVNSGKVYDVAQFKKAFDKLMQSHAMKSKLKTFLRIF